MELNISKTEFISLIMDAKMKLELISQTIETKGFNYIQNYSKVRSDDLYHDIVLNISEEVTNKILKGEKHVFNVIKNTLLSRKIDHYLLKVDIDILEAVGYKFKEELL